MMPKLIFLPGASGRRAMWDSWIDRFKRDYSTAVVGWPGLDNEPENPGILEIADLSQLVSMHVEPRSVLIAQSMGGVVALHTLLNHSDSVAALILCVTSGGLDRTEFDCDNWRPDFVRNNPGTPAWFLDHDEDLSQTWATISVPVLLIWGGDDRISPVAMGNRLNQLIPNSSLLVIQGAGHDVAETHAEQLLPVVSDFLKKI
jgi:poly(3-hydroxyoctanoate) depolymerase